MDIRAAEISAILKEQIANFGSDVEVLLDHIQETGLLIGLTENLDQI